MAQGCTWWARCPEVICQVDHGEQFHHKSDVSMESSLHVLLLRDPRDVATALRHKNCASTYECAIQRIRAVSNWTEARYREHSELPGSFLLFFEDVAVHPEETLRSLTSFLGLELSLNDKEIGSWRTATQHGVICQTRSAYPSWIASYVSSVMGEELSLHLWNHWASCNATWAPEPCHGRAVLEVHEGLHGDVCRWPEGSFTCPVTCKKSQAEYCVGAKQQPCRAAAIADHWRAGFVPNPLTPRVMHTFYEQSAHDDRENARQLTLATWEPSMGLGLVLWEAPTQSS